MVGLVKFGLVDSFKHRLHITEEWLWSSLVGDGDGEMGFVGDIDFRVVVLAVDDILFRNVGNGF
jgi:hypothetical protein